MEFPCCFVFHFSAFSAFSSEKLGRLERGKGRAVHSGPTRRTYLASAPLAKLGLVLRIKKLSLFIVSGSCMSSFLIVCAKFRYGKTSWQRFYNIFKTLPRRRHDVPTTFLSYTSLPHESFCGHDTLVTATRFCFTLFLHFTLFCVLWGADAGHSVHCPAVGKSIFRLA